MPVSRVCVYCASSRSAHPEFAGAAARLGRTLAEAGVELVYGGGSIGSMGALADGALEAGGRVVGVIPRLLLELEQQHAGVELCVVDDLHERKRRLLEDADAVIALPGGSGTWDELMEAITMKRLGLFLHPIVLVNVRDYYAPLVELFERAITERFLDERHRAMWTVVSAVDEVLPSLEDHPTWDEDARSFAAP